MLQRAPAGHGPWVLPAVAAAGDTKATITLAIAGDDIGEANESKTQKALRNEVASETDRTITTAANGAITIPAVACSSPTGSTRRIRFMKSHLGGMQLHYSRMGPPEVFEYTFDAPSAGKYALTARVVTTSANQQLFVTANDAAEPILKIVGPAKTLTFTAAEFVAETPVKVPTFIAPPKRLAALLASARRYP